MLVVHFFHGLSYFTDLQGSQTRRGYSRFRNELSYFTDLQGSQTYPSSISLNKCLVTLLIYKVLKQPCNSDYTAACLVTLLIYKVLKL